MLRTLILFGTVAVFLYFVNTGIMNAENNIKNATVAYFELAPVDPRSLIQGDYMTLRYTIENDARDVVSGNRDRGQLVLSIDENQIAHFERRYFEDDTLEDDEILVNFYARSSWSVRVGVDSFFFQEGQAEAYSVARYAEVRILEDGGVMLIHLADENRETIVPE